MSDGLAAAAYEAMDAFLDAEGVLKPYDPRRKPRPRGKNQTRKERDARPKRAKPGAQPQGKRKLPKSKRRRK